MQQYAKTKGIYLPDDYSDYHIKTRIEDMIAKVEIEMKFYSPLNVKISIEDRTGAVVALGSIAEEGTVVLEIASPELWNTENPYLYKLIFETENEVIGKDNDLE